LSASAAPDGYEAAELRSAIIVARRGQLAAVQSALESGTLHEYAARHQESRSLSGRGVAYAAPLPNGERVVVRHSRHGGLFAPVTGDRFLTPTRAPYELTTALRLEAAGVPTPKIVAYVIYPAGLLLRRSDVASREIADSSDLAAVLMTGSPNDRRAALESAAALIGLLSATGARHHDLNLKNILLARDAARRDSPIAYVLDVDRVEFGRPGDSRVTERNLDRFMRSARKWRELHGARIEEAELVRVAASVRRFVSSRPSSGARAITRS
jgi:tRNA A-37 threonylcarbamoyl transferase component Bud32